MLKPWRFFLCISVVLFSITSLAQPAENQAAVQPSAPAATAAQPPAPAAAAAPAVAAAQTPAPKIPEIVNFADIAKNLKLSRFNGQKFDHKVKVAILDNGFAGYEQELGKSLPADTVFHKSKNSEADTIADPSLHGLMMAQLVAGVIKQSGVEANYELHLFNAFGYTKFSDAVEQVIDGQFDLVLYSQVWEYGGNGDSKGYINARVDKAIAAGVIWINASGNFGRLTRLVPVDSKLEGQTEWVVFPDMNGKTQNGAKILCKLPKGNQCKLRLVLAWNDFKDDPEEGTDKDLDLFVYDSNKKQIGVSNRHQGLKANPSDPLSSMIPRELIELDLNPGLYNVRVSVKSKNFSASQDRLRLTAGGLGIEMADSNDDETLLPPADNAGVIVVGASDDFQTSHSVKLKRPDLYLKSLVVLKDGSKPFASSNAAAMAAGLAVIHLGLATDKSQAALLTQLRAVTQSAPTMNSGTATAEEPRRGASTHPSQQPGQAANSQRQQPSPNSGGGVQAPARVVAPQGCAVPVNLPMAYPSVMTLLSRGGMQPMRWNGRFVIAVEYNFMAAHQLAPLMPNQRFVIGPAGILVFYAAEIGRLPLDHYEVVPLQRIPLCQR